jgi:hypothetical protein
MTNTEYFSTTDQAPTREQFNEFPWWVVTYRCVFVNNTYERGYDAFVNVDAATDFVDDLERWAGSIHIGEYWLAAICCPAKKIGGTMRLVNVKVLGGLARSDVQETILHGVKTNPENHLMLWKPEVVLEPAGDVKRKRPQAGSIAAHQEAQDAAPKIRARRLPNRGVAVAADAIIPKAKNRRAALLAGRQAASQPESQEPVMKIKRRRRPADYNPD